jgi:hypothetical protein
VSPSRGPRHEAAFVNYAYTGKLVYNVMKGAEYSLSLCTSVSITKECNVMVNSDELIGTTEYLTV